MPTSASGCTRKGGRLGVAVLARVEVEQEIDQRALQPRAGPGVEREGAAADLRGALEVEQSELFSRGRCGFGARNERRLLAPGADDGVVLADAARRAVPRAGDSGRSARGSAARLELPGLVFETRDLLAELAHLRLDRRSVFALRLSSRRSPCSSFFGRPGAAETASRWRRSRSHAQDFIDRGASSRRASRGAVSRSRAVREGGGCRAWGGKPKARVC